MRRGSDGKLFFAFADSNLIYGNWILAKDVAQEMNLDGGREDIRMLDTQIEFI